MLHDLSVFRFCAQKKSLVKLTFVTIEITNFVIGELLQVGGKPLLAMSNSIIMNFLINPGKNTNGSPQLATQLLYFLHNKHF